MTPASLNHAHLGICKVINTLFQNVRRRQEIGIQNEEKFAFCLLKSVVQGPGFEPYTILSPQHNGIKSLCPELGNFALRNLVRFIRRIVKNLDLQFFNRVLNFTDRFQQTLDYVNFVVNRKLDRYHRQVVKSSRGRRLAMPVLEIKMNDQISVDAIGRKNENHEKIADRPKQHPGFSMHIKE